MLEDNLLFSVGCRLVGCGDGCSDARAKPMATGVSVLGRVAADGLNEGAWLDDAIAKRLNLENHPCIWIASP